MQSSIRSLGVVAATAAVVGESIGSGIFLTLGGVALAMGSPGGTLLLWAAISAMALCGALSYSALAVRFPQAGGEVVYLEHSYGPNASFLSGWVGAIIMLPGVAAAMAVGAASYLSAAMPALAAFGHWLPALLLLAFAIINMIGTAVSGRLMSAMTALKLVLLIGFVFWALASGKAHPANLFPFFARMPSAQPLFGGIAAASVGAFFSISGWWDAAKLAGEVRDPERTMPRALGLGVGIMAALYLMIAICAMLITPIAQMLPGAAGVAQLSAQLFGGGGSRLVSAAIAVCILSALAALSLASPRITYGMACGGTFFSSFGKLHPRFRTPWNSILLHTALALLVLTLGQFDRMLSYIAFVAVLLLAFTVSVLFRLTPRPRAWWYPAAPVIFIVCCIAIAALVAMHSPVESAIGAALIAVGYPAGLWVRKQR